MAKGNTGAEDRAKVKLRVIEFELEGANSSVENSIRQLTTALTARTNGTPKLQPSKPPKELASGDASQDYEQPEELEAEVVEESADAAAGRTKTTRPKGKPKPPTYLPDLITDFDGFKAFAKEKAPESKALQYLVAACWLKEHGNCPTVNADKIYTCYQTAKWPSGFNDWSQTFHNLVHSEQMRKVGKGEFAINPTGEHDVKTLNG